MLSHETLQKALADTDVPASAEAAQPQESNA